MAATPPAITNIFFFKILFFSNSLNAIEVFLYNISSIVFWNDAARSNFSLSLFIFLEIFNIAVLSPAKDKLHPPLLNIGFGRLYLFGSPLEAKISICGPPGNSTPSNFAVLSKASPNASSIVVPSLLYLLRPSTLRYCVCPPDISKKRYGKFNSVFNFGLKA